jgi:hypothetical protein
LLSAVAVRLRTLAGAGQRVDSARQDYVNEDETENKNNTNGAGRAAIRQKWAQPARPRRLGGESV